jgi:hypothetical protein
MPDRRAAIARSRRAPGPAPGMTRRSRVVVTALALAAVVAWSPAERAMAQPTESPRIVAPATILAEPASQAAISIQVGPPGRIPNNTFVRLRGLPASVSLTEGYAIAPGSWAVPLVGLGSLKAIVPAGVSGRTEITIHLVGVDGATLAETKTALVIGPAAMIAPTERPTAERPPQQRASAAAIQEPPPKSERPSQQARPPTLAPDQKERAERMIANGDRHLEQGNVGAARMFFQRAAEAGLAAGAIKMAATYDPAELDRLGVKVQGAIPDRAEARKWYERARALGAPEADERLARIGGS